MATAEEKMTALESQLEKAFKLAESLNKSTDAIIKQGEERKIARQKKNLMEKTEKIHEIKELLREVKITAETDEQETEAAINEIKERAESIIKCKCPVFEYSKQTALIISASIDHTICPRLACICSLTTRLALHGLGIEHSIMFIYR